MSWLCKRYTLTGWQILIVIGVAQAGMWLLAREIGQDELEKSVTGLAALFVAVRVLAGKSEP